MTPKEEIRIRNPFHDPLVTELIEDPPRYRKIFSEQILIGEALQVFQPANVVLIGPQGSGKSMILNLVRHAVVSEWLSSHGKPPRPLKHIEPFFGISINLVRANFHAFGRRSISKAMGDGRADPSLDIAGAADFLNHYLFREYLQGLRLLLHPRGARLAAWLGVRMKGFSDSTVASRIASLDCWFGYYSGCDSTEALLSRCETRLTTWRSFLNANMDHIPKEIWETKSSIEGPLHALGNVLRDIGPRSPRLPLFVVIDQYEVLPELNPAYGTTLQRLVNTLIKLRDPVVFYKIGARTYDWGQELRIWGAESRIEVQRDYLMINLADLLMRDEDSSWLFPRFARDVAVKRVKVEGHYGHITRRNIVEVLGKWTPTAEAQRYFKDKSRRQVVIGKVSDLLRLEITRLCGRNPSPLDLRLAGAWVLQQKKRGRRDADILRELKDRPWKRWSWYKERSGVALLQIASRANQKRRYFGWETVLYLSGGNILAFLLLCAEIWDLATKVNLSPVTRRPLPPHVQAQGIFVASEKWSVRDRNENLGGSKRYEVLSRLGPAIRDALIQDGAISNPGYSGFSLRETDLSRSDHGRQAARFLQNAVSWAIFEERTHTSKSREGATRRKWYLHPLLSPFFGIPYIRVKEPYYATVEEVYEWIYGESRIKFAHKRLTRAEATIEDTQLPLPLDRT